ncbi:ammonium transporter [Sphingobium bisphenolivorans]|uniref:ammonium transporter n=1 Tax=Sphingobium bisphenolivorans TaxID=1335760 RepID=UPI00039F62CB|nr:ammonium transporter [Sphingobium bisphenolivorans]
MLRGIYWLGLAGGIASVATVAEAAPVGGAIDKADTLLLIFGAALVLFMTLPGLALFYGGLVRAKNFLSVLMHCFAIAALASILWFLGVYSLVFRGDNPFIGDLSAIGLHGLSAVRQGLTMPENVFALYQMTFAIITPALIVGAFPERVRFGWLMLFSALWLLLVYAPAAHWLWGDGWLAQRGGRDFAGGIVVHTTAGIAALVLAIMIGPRKGFPQSMIPPHSPAMTMIGAGMLWVGWFGFNGGSALVADQSAGGAIIATHLAACSAALTWAAAEQLKIGKPTSIGVVTGAVAGLATITPAAGYVSPTGAVIIGILGSLVCFAAVLAVKHRWRVDDTLDVFAVHGVGGMLGSILVAVFASEALGGAGMATSLGMGSQLLVQAEAVLIVALWSAVMTLIAARAAAMLLPMRVNAEQEHDGLDLSLHGERAYEFD